MKVRRKTNIHPIKFTLACVGILVVSVGVWTVYAYNKEVWPFQAITADRSVEDVSDGSPLSPEQELEQSQNGKKNIQDEQEPEKDDSGKNIVEVGVAYADVFDGAVEVRAFTPSVVEGDGRCTATLTGSNVTISDTTNAFIDSTTSQCEPIRIPLAKFAQSGTWKLVVTYSSSKSKGISETVEVRI